MATEQDESAPSSGGQTITESDSKEYPAGERCSAAEPAGVVIGWQMRPSNVTIRWPGNPPSLGANVYLAPPVPAPLTEERIEQLYDETAGAMGDDYSHAGWLAFARLIEAEAKRAADMPDEKSAIGAMFIAYIRLKELGWKDIIDCPKDGSSFSVIEAGSARVHTVHYSGGWWRHGTVDLYPSNPVLFKALP